MYSHSYITITDRKQVADGRNAFANRPPRSIGASASPLMKMIEPGHYEVKVTEQERRMVRYWIESGAAYPGTYAAVGNGMIGRYIENNVERNDADWPSVAAAAEVIQRRCGRCHAGASALPLSPSHDAANRSRHIVYNLTRPEKSLMLLGPLAQAAGGYGTCQAKAQVGPTAQAPPVFGDTNDPDYQKILTMISDAKKWLDDVKRFDMPGFRPNADYVREMKKYGVLPMNIGPNDPIDPYATDQAYWRSLWYQPVVQ
jgi:hypothetical protein